MRKGGNQALGTKIEDFKKTCEEADIRITPQRLEIFREIARATHHPSAEEPYKRVKPKMPSISLDTVYRTLATFEGCGFVSRILVFEDRTRFDPNTSPHHHLVCLACRSIEDFFWPLFELLDLPSHARGWGNFSSRQAQLTGLCRNCLKKSKDAS